MGLEIGLRIQSHLTYKHYSFGEYNFLDIFTGNLFYELLINTCVFISYHEICSCAICGCVRNASQVHNGSAFILINPKNVFNLLLTDAKTTIV